MEERVRGIGQMARESGLTVSALRFYDGAGVLPPARVDPHSNYRWYSDDQVRTARLIARLRRVGLPLADIGRVVARRRDPAVVDEILQAHLTRLEDGLADARRELSAARALLAQESTMTPTPTPTPTMIRIRTTAAELHRALRTVRHAVSTDPELPMLTAVLLDVHDGAAQVVASDRYRLAVAALPGAEAGPSGGVLVPVELVDELLAALAHAGDGVVTVVADAGRITVEGTPVRGAPLDLDFPDYRRVLRDGAAHRVAVDAATLRAALAAAPLRPAPREDGGEQEVAVLALGADGDVRFTGEGVLERAVLEMALNPEFLLQALDAGGDGQLVLELDGPIAPLAIRDPDRTGDVRMVMPVRLT